jgi:hypothetical protein
MAAEYDYLPRVRDRDGELRAKLEAILEARRRQNPDLTLADLIREGIRDLIARHDEASKPELHGIYG